MDSILYTCQVHRMQLANLELFSSNPASVRVSVAERYPSVEWIEVGSLQLADNRQMQSFDLTTSIYAKYMKVREHKI